MSTQPINLKLWQNLQCKDQNSTNKKDKIVIKTLKIKLWKNSKTQVLTRIENSNYDKTWTLKLWQNSKNLKCDKTLNVTKHTLWQKSN